MAFTRESLALRCSIGDVLKTAKDYGLYMSIAPKQAFLREACGLDYSSYSEGTSSKVIRWQDSQTGGGAVRLNYFHALGVVLIDSHSGYEDSRFEVAEWMRVIYGAEAAGDLAFSYYKALVQEGMYQ